MIFMAEPTYEERFRRAGRLARRAGRAIRWPIRRALGLPRRILVETRWRLGDEIMAIPIYEALHNRHPGCEVFALCRFPEILEGNPFVRIADPAHIPGCDKYVCLRSGPRTRPRIEHYAKLAGLAVPGIAPRLYYDDWTTPLLEGVKRPIVALSAGASWFTKRWPVERWLELGAALHARGYTIVELGVSGEEIGCGVSLVGHTNVREAARVLHVARLFVGCDSGLMHLALAAGTPAVALFGPTDPSILVRENPNLSPVLSELGCQGCWNRPETGIEAGACARGVGAECLESITVDKVLARACAVLDALP
jgi:ADP-heptose:LPS heptosyltransferase